jgi:hypothetical protein
MTTSPPRDITVEDLLKIIGDKEVQLCRQSAHIKALSDKVMELEAEKANGNNLKNTKS